MGSRRSVAPKTGYVIKYNFLQDSLVTIVIYLQIVLEHEY